MISSSPQASNSPSLTEILPSGIEPQRGIASTQPVLPPQLSDITFYQNSRIVHELASQMGKNPNIAAAFKDDTHGNINDLEPKEVLNKINQTQQEFIDAVGGRDAAVAMGIPLNERPPAPVCGESANFLTHAFVDQPGEAPFNPENITKEGGFSSLSSLKETLKNLDAANSHIIRVQDSRLGHAYVIDIPPQEKKPDPFEVFVFMYQTDLGEGVMPPLQLKDWMDSSGKNPVKLSNFINYWNKAESGESGDVLKNELTELFEKDKDPKKVDEKRYLRGNGKGLRFNLHTVEPDSFKRNIERIQMKSSLEDFADLQEKVIHEHGYHNQHTSNRFRSLSKGEPDFLEATDPQPNPRSMVETASPIGGRHVNMGASAQASLQGDYQSAINRQFNAIEQLKDISCRYNAADSPSERKQIAAELMDRKFVADMSSILVNQINDPYSETPRDMEVDKIKLKACMDYVDLVHSLIASGDLNARDLFNRLIQPAPDLKTPTPFLFSLASVASGKTDEQCRLANAMGSLLDTVTQQTGADLRPKIRKLLLNPQFDMDTQSKYTDFYARLIGDGQFKSVTGGVIGTYKLGRSGLIPTSDEVKAAGGSKARIKKIEAAQHYVSRVANSEKRQGGGSLTKFISENILQAKPANLAEKIGSDLSSQYLEKIERKENDIFKGAKNDLGIKVETRRYQQEQEKILRQEWDKIINDSVKDEFDWEIKSMVKDNMSKMAEKSIKEGVKKIMSDPNTNKLIRDRVTGAQSTPPSTRMVDSQLSELKNHATQIKDGVVNDINRTRKEQADQERIIDERKRMREEAEDYAKQANLASEEADRQARREIEDRAEQIRRAAEEQKEKARIDADEQRAEREREREGVARDQAPKRTQQGQTPGRGYAGPSVLPDQDGHFRY